MIGETDKSGTLVRFRPDEEIFEELDFQYDVLAKRFEELAYLNPGIKIEFFDEKTQNRDVFKYEGGIISPCSSPMMPSRMRCRRPIFFSFSSRNSGKARGQGLFARSCVADFLIEGV